MGVGVGSGAGLGGGESRVQNIMGTQTQAPKFGNVE